MPVSSPYAVFRAADLGWAHNWAAPPPRPRKRLEAPAAALIQGELFALQPSLLKPV
ncbi:MAG: hypothetical protein R6W06_09560 [Prochlorococcaceae cyanobacterium]